MKPIVIPYSETNIHEVESTANYYSPFFQNIISYYHNNFEIHITLEEFTPSDPFPLATLSAQELEPLFVQAIAMHHAAERFQLHFIDYGNLQYRPGQPLKFSLQLPHTSGPCKLADPLDIRILLAHFNQNPIFKDLDVSNYQDTYRSLVVGYTFDPNQVYIYRYSDLAAGILKAHPITHLKNNANIKISIDTTPVVESIVCRDIINHHLSETVFLAQIPAISYSIPRSLANLIPHDQCKEECLPDDFIAIIDRLTLF